MTLAPCVCCHVSRAAAGHLSGLRTERNTAQLRGAVYHGRWIVYVKCTNCGYTTWPGIMTARDDFSEAEVLEARAKAAVQWNALWLTGSIDGAKDHDRQKDFL